MGRSYKQSGGITPHAGAEQLETFNAPPLAANTNDYVVENTAFFECSLLIISASAPINLTGLQGALNNRELVILNVGAATITLKANSGLSAAGHLFNFSGDVALAQWEALEMVGNAAASGWVQVGAASGGGGGGAPSTATYVTQTNQTATLPNSTLAEYDLNPDTHTSVPANVANDEFDFGSALDTAGARFAGAIPWTIYP